MSNIFHLDDPIQSYMEVRTVALYSIPSQVYGVRGAHGNRDRDDDSSPNPALVVLKALWCALESPNPSQMVGVVAVLLYAIPNQGV